MWCRSVGDGYMERGSPDIVHHATEQKPPNMSGPGAQSGNDTDVPFGTAPNKLEPPMGPDDIGI